jgi:hypothetical protein
MSEVLTEKKLADTAEPVDATTVESTTIETGENGEAHMADGTLLEEMKKAVKQSMFTFFFLLSMKSQLNLPLSLFLLSLSKKVEFYFADANLPYDKCTQFLGVLSLFFLC